MTTSFQTQTWPPVPVPLHQSPLAQRPTTVSDVFRAAARLIVANGLHQGDHVPDPFDRVLSSPHSARPMSIVAALKCASSGDPHLSAPLADESIIMLALRLEVDGEGGPLDGGVLALEAHIDAWGDAEGRTAESAVAVLEAAADAAGVVL